MATLHHLTDRLRLLYRRLVRRAEDDRLRRIVDVLTRTPVFETLRRADRWQLAEMMHPRHYAPGEYLYYEGDPGLGLYVVVRGRVSLLTTRDDGEPVELRQVGRHGFFGEQGLLGAADLRRLETARALTETHVLGFFSPDLRTLQHRKPAVAAAFALALATYLARRQEAFVDTLARREGRPDALRLFHRALPDGEPAPPETP
ncbi:MAG: Crp/Fnr family transcriptional regulator [Rhodothermaceae bacterium]|nr:MAG: Crp/Fnr family transcriptional regulator [Rhodothermaceae bacterium]